jgi:hypothetical protein
MAAVLALSACGASPGSSAAADPAQMPFLAIRPEDARLAFAANDLSARVGHDLSYEVSAEVMGEHATNIQEILSDTLEAIARGLEHERIARPDEVARTLVVLKSIRVQSNEKIRDHRAYIEGGVLVLLVPTKTTVFTTDVAVAAAFARVE